MKKNKIYTSILLVLVIMLPLSGWAVVSDSISDASHTAILLESKIANDRNFRIKGSLFLSNEGDYQYYDNIIDFNFELYSSGSYIVLVKNGSTLEMQKISVSR